MTARLVTALKHRGLSALGRTTETLLASGPGTLTQQVYTPAAPKSALASKRKGQTAVLIASANHTFPAAGNGTLSLRLTTAGRHLVRAAKRVRIAIVTSFAPTSGTPVVTTERLDVRPRSAKQKARQGRLPPTSWNTARVSRP
jgi:hypothetical protein